MSGASAMSLLRQSRSSPPAGWTFAIVAVAAVFLAGGAQAQQQRPPSKMPLPLANPPAKRIITQGLAKTVTEDLVPCGVNQLGMNVRKNPVGEITAQDGTKLTV